MLPLQTAQAVDLTSSMVAFTLRSFHETLQEKGITVQLLHNQRTPGASGAWNTALHSLLQQLLVSSSGELPGSPSGLEPGGSVSSSSWWCPSKLHMDPTCSTFVAILGE
jgi:hypothetical protein